MFKKEQKLKKQQEKVKQNEKFLQQIGFLKKHEDSKTVAIQSEISLAETQDLKKKE